MTIAPKPKPDSALIIVGHGSTENPDSSTPYLDHAREIRRRSLFGEVHCVFWKEEPSLRELWWLTDLHELYVVPDFISEGYFTQEVIPRELELDGPTSLVKGRTVHYCSPVGVHPSMTGLLLRHAAEAAPDVDPADATLFVVGHGTGLNPNSRRAIEDQVGRIRRSGAGYASVQDAYMEESPLIAGWDQLAPTGEVIVVPFFISDGLHSYQDIPVLLGMEEQVGLPASQRDVFRHNPHHLRGKRLHYARAIGTDIHMADVILDQVASFDLEHGRS